MTWLLADGILERNVIGHNRVCNLLHVATLWCNCGLTIDTYNVYNRRDHV